MPIYLPKETESLILAPAGTHSAVCSRIVDLGTQSTTYGPKPQILISWELTDEAAVEERPFTVSRVYNLSVNRKSALRSDVEGWLGRTLAAADFGRFDLAELLGRTCTVSIRHDDRDGRANT